MTFLIAYMIKSVVASGILYAWYLVALRNRKCHVYNRIYLLSAAAISLVLPFANFKWYDIPVVSSPVAAPRNDPGSHTYTTVVVIACLALVSLFLLTVMVLKIARVYRIKRRYGHIRLGNIDFIRTDIGNAPFSFLNNLFWRTDMSTTDSNGKKILRHEMTHIRQRHTHDQLFMQAIACLWWMNPFYWLMQKELNMVHEFMADAAAIEEGDTGAFAMMLLRCHNRGRHLDPSHYFSGSPVLRRLNMIASAGKRSPGYLRKFLALPLTVLLLVLFSFKISAIKNNVPIVQQIEKGQPDPTPHAARTFYIRYRYWTVI